MRARTSVCTALLVLLSALLITGCGGLIYRYSNQFEGKADYQYQVESIDGKGKEQTAWLKYVNTENTRVDKTRLFQENEIITVNLKTARFNKIPEGFFERNLNAKRPIRGEVVIVANITDGPQAPLTDPAGAGNPGRVVFYSGELKEGQFINESFNTIYGPIAYKGKPMTIDFTVVEMDAGDRAQWGAILDTLAKLGAARTGVGGTALNVLTKLGSALVNGNKDDVLGHYRVTLMPAFSRGKADVPLLLEGDYVITRIEDKADYFDWNDLYYDSKQGRLELCVKAKDSLTRNCSTQDAPDFIAFTISRDASKDLGVGMAAQTTLGQLEGEIAKAESPKQMTEAITDAMLALNQQVAFAKARNALNVIETAADKSVVKSYAANDLAKLLLCAHGANRPDRPKDISQDVYGEPCGGEGYNKKALSEQEMEFVARRISDLECGTTVDLTPGGLKANKTADLAKALATCKAKAPEPAKPTEPVTTQPKTETPAKTGG